MNVCERYEIMISALLDGELGEQEKAELSAHIVGCERCSAMAAAFAAASGALTERLEEPPDKLQGAIMEKVEAAAKVKRGQSRFMRLRPIIAAAACVAVVAVTLLAANHGVRSVENAVAGGSSANTFVAAPDETAYAGGEGSADKNKNGAADIGGENGGADPMEAPAPVPAEAPAETAMDNDAPEARSMTDGAVSEITVAENEAGQDEPEIPAGLPEIEVEAVAAGEGAFTAAVLADSSGFFDPGTTLTVLSDEAVSPGTRVTVRYSGISFGTDPGEYYVTAEEIERGE